MLFTAFLTAYYTFRLYFEVFEGPEIIPPPPAGGHGHDTVDKHLLEDPHQGQVAKDPAHAHDEHAHHHHEPRIMIWPLVLLAIGAIFAGWLNFPERARSLGGFLGESPSLRESFLFVNQQGQRHGEVAPAPFGQMWEAEHEEPAIKAQDHRLHTWMMAASALIAILGIVLAYLLHLKYRDKAEEIAAKFQPITRLLERKYYIDEIYQDAIVEPLRKFGRAMFAVDRYGIDGLVTAVSFVPQAFGFALKIFTQRGYLQGYAVTMLLGIAVILWFVFS
jgi:NADH-quinone oxidoreductase subunit L